MELHKTLNKERNFNFHTDTVPFGFEGCEPVSVMTAMWTDQRCAGV